MLSRIKIFFRSKNKNKCICKDIVNNPLFCKGNIVCHKHKSYKSLLCENYHCFNNYNYYLENCLLPYICYYFPNFKKETISNIFQDELKSIICYMELIQREYYCKIFDLETDEGHETWEYFLKKKININFNANRSYIDFLKNSLLEKKNDSQISNTIKQNSNFLKSCGIIFYDNQYQYDEIYFKKLINKIRKLKLCDKFYLNYIYNTIKKDNIYTINLSLFNKIKYNYEEYSNRILINYNYMDPSQNIILEEIICREMVMGNFILNHYCVCYNNCWINGIELDDISKTINIYNLIQIDKIITKKIKPQYKIFEYLDINLKEYFVIDTINSI